METLKQARDLVHRNARAGVAYGHLRKGIDLTQRNFDLALKGELERVRQEIEKDLFPHVGQASAKAAIRGSPI